MTLDTAWTSGTVPAALTAKASPVEAYHIEFTATAAGGFTITDLNGNILLTFVAPTTGTVVAYDNSKQALKLPMGGRWILSAISGTGGQVQIWY
jgi:hypothetical protein